MLGVIINFFIIIVSYLALIRPLFVELGFPQIKRKYIVYYHTILRDFRHEGVKLFSEC